MLRSDLFPLFDRFLAVDAPNNQFGRSQGSQNGYATKLRTRETVGFGRVCSQEAANEIVQDRASSAQRCVAALRRSVETVRRVRSNRCLRSCEPRNPRVPGMLRSFAVA